MSSNIICHAYKLIAKAQFSVLMYHSYVHHISKMRKGLAKSYITERQNRLLQIFKYQEF